MQEKFPHLNFITKISGRPKLGGGGSSNSLSNEHKRNREKHCTTLTNAATKTLSEWVTDFEARKQQGAPPLNKDITPVFFKVNPEKLTPDFDLESFGIEIISEEEDGYIIGASMDHLKTLQEKIYGFKNAVHSTGKIADFWEILDGNRDAWRPKHILSPYLLSIWAKIEDDDTLEVEVSIAFAKPLKAPPDPTKQGAAKRISRYDAEILERDNLLFQRQEHFEEFINYYGQLTSSIVELDDSFGCQVSITGKGLKDLVLNYQFVFEVSEIAEIETPYGKDGDSEIEDYKILPPGEGATEVGVINSGIMEGHRLIEKLIIPESSKSYVDYEKSTADYVEGGGHGTKVAGAILFPAGISATNFPYLLPCYIRNLRVLNKESNLNAKYPAELMRKIVEENTSCKIFNLSISERTPSRKKHMSTWAAMIDKLSYEHDVLFIVSAGNLHFSTIKRAIEKGLNYPEYLFRPFSRIANPSQSFFSISVGSINHCSYSDEEWESLGKTNEISAFSRTGLGIWNSIKPDVVEFGGGIVISQNGHCLIKNNEQTSIELIRSTLHGGKAIGKDTVGTSFSAPKVSHIAAILKQLYPKENSNLLRAFIAQGARLPTEHFLSPSKEALQLFGYGLPSLERVTRNSESRITFYNSQSIAAEEGHIYSILIPDDLRDQGDEYDVLIEVTLAYSAQVRRTRQKTRSYLSTWIDWTNAHLDEDLEDFSQRALRQEDENQKENPNKQKNGEIINWFIRERRDYGEVQDIRRHDSTLQKDWAILKSYQLPRELIFAVRGHKGWDRKKMPVPYSLVVSMEILNGELPIYEIIRIENQVEIQI